MTCLRLALSLLCFGGLCLSSTSQLIDDPNHLLRDHPSEVEVVLELIDGTAYAGELIDMTDKYIVINLETDRRDITIPRSLIEKVLVKGLVRSLDLSMPNPDYYFITPTAIPTVKRRFVFRNQMLVVNSIRYGVSDNVSIGGGFELISLFSGQRGGAYHLNLKSGFQLTDQWHIGGGYLALIEKRYRDVRIVHLPYVVSTWGSGTSNMSVRAEYGFNETRDEGTLTFGIAGRVRIARKAGLYFESVVVRRGTSSDSNPLLGNGGFQLFDRKNTFTVGLFVLALSDEIALPIPAAGFARVF